MRRFDNYTMDTDTRGRREVIARMYHKTHRFPISAGRYDDVTIYRDGRALYVLSLDHRFDYVGLEGFIADEYAEDGPRFGLFLQDWQLEEYGVSLDSAPYNIIRHLLQWWQD